MLLTRASRLSSPPDPSVFPVWQLTLLALVRVAEPIALTSILPYAYPLALWCHVGDKTSASFYAGLLVAAYALAEAATGMFWGGLSDKVGRKPILMLGCAGTIVSLLIVGFSVNFWMALFGRFLGGALNGNIGVIQTMVGELVVNPKHEPRAYAVMPFVWSVGTIVGPCIGGYFASPAANFPGSLVDIELFVSFPFLLPNLICSTLMVISIVAGYLCLQETHPDKQPWSQISQGDIEQPRHLQADPSVMATQSTDITPAANLTQESYGTFNRVSEDVVEEEWFLKADGTSQTPSLRGESSPKILTRRVIMLTIALGIFTYHSMTYDHLLPIFCQDERVPSGVRALARSISSSSSGSLAGGLGLSIKDVGFIMSVNGIIALVVQVLVFPVMASWLGVWKVFLGVTLLHPLAYFVVPWLALLPPRLLYPGLYASLALRNCLSILAYPVLLILLKEAAPSRASLGRINGLAASTGAACRTAASPIAGALYAVGIKADFVALAWWASAAVAALAGIQALLIRRDQRAETHHVHSAVPACRFGEARDHSASKNIGRVVRIRIAQDELSEDERTPLIRG